MSGTAGLLAVVAALEHGKKVALATKEILVGYGEPVMSSPRKPAATVLPIDSELSAVHQCLADEKDKGPKDKGQSPEPDTPTSEGSFSPPQGGPFAHRGSRPGEADRRTQASAWSMGRKITVRLGYMMNKGT